MDRRGYACQQSPDAGSKDITCTGCSYRYTLPSDVNCCPLTDNSKGTYSPFKLERMSTMGGEMHCTCELLTCLATTIRCPILHTMPFVDSTSETYRLMVVPPCIGPCKGKLFKMEGSNLDTCWKVKGSGEPSLAWAMMVMIASSPRTPTQRTPCG